MDWRSITVEAECEIYLKDVKDKILEMLSDDELIEELIERDVNYGDKSEKYPCSTNSTHHPTTFVGIFATSWA